MSSPTVTIVTPIHQGAAHLAACVESVREQDYENWTHLLVDNRSTDGTDRIADELARQDSRIRVVHCDEHVRMLANWNRALALVPEESTYVRQLNVDDRLEPKCLSLTVAAAERHPDVAIISSYFLNGRRLLPKTKLREETRVDGREVVRNLFLGRADFLAQPSVLLLRRKAIRGWPGIYEPQGFPPNLESEPPLSQADKEGFLETLTTSDLLFVPERLVVLCEDANSATGYSWRVGAWHAGWMELLMRHGDRFLDESEIKRAMWRLVFKYVRSSTWRSLKGRSKLDAEFMMFHHHSLEYLIPALHERGFEREADVLNVFSRIVGTR